MEHLGPLPAATTNSATGSALYFAANESLIARIMPEMFHYSTKVY